MVLFVNVSVPAKVAIVPVVGKVTFVTPVLVNVVLKLPAVVKSFAVKNQENAEISCVISMGYRGYSIVLHYDPTMYSFCEIRDPNGVLLSPIKFGCGIEGINRAQRVIDAILD